MTITIIEIDSNKTFEVQDDARDWLRDLVNVGILFLESHVDDFNKVIVNVDQQDTYQTISDAKNALKKYVDIGLVRIKVYSKNKK